MTLMTTTNLYGRLINVSHSYVCLPRSLCNNAMFFPAISTRQSYNIIYYINIMILYTASASIYELSPYRALPLRYIKRRVWLQNRHTYSCNQQYVTKAAISPRIVLVSIVPDPFCWSIGAFLRKQSGTCEHCRALPYIFGEISDAIASVLRGSGANSPSTLRTTRQRATEPIRKPHRACETWDLRGTLGRPRRPRDDDF